ncbi:gamma-glutamylcyclotransferase [Erythrobacter sp.]|uniref:gamma-glutamylcyclotransferase family protein n=1 Tax=Erythrobacter sp. TaxID=1042 RepID=UPI001425CD31|nr:gamma-glutamylcyclotransferase family protein [Erythrobacter sp.]QIQ87673.1 MAG: gamma-glutamylcyclotransferase [Erythrobacter sp.]
MTQPTYLFFYGVLREGVGDWPFLAGLGMGSQASVEGALFAIPDAKGWYPALVLTRAGHATNVVGSLHDAGEVDLAVLDAFEGPQYERMAVPVDGWQAGGNEAQAYVWTGELPEGAEPIHHGDFVRWLAETGRRAYAGE